MTLDDLLDRRVPLAMACALLTQAAAVVWWASARDADLRFQTQRIDQITLQTADTRSAETEMLQRLARLEERLNADTAALDRIDRNLTLALKESRK